MPSVNSRLVSRLVPTKESACGMVLILFRAPKRAELANLSTSADNAASVWSVSATSPYTTFSLARRFIALAAAGGKGGRFLRAASVFTEVSITVLFSYRGAARCPRHTACFHGGSVFCLEGIG